MTWTELVAAKSSEAPDVTVVCVEDVGHVVLTATLGPCSFTFDVPVLPLNAGYVYDAVSRVRRGESGAIVVEG